MEQTFPGRGQGQRSDEERERRRGPRHRHAPDDHDHRPAPTPVLAAALGLVIVSLLSVAWVSWFGERAAPAELSPLVSERMLSVTDLADGIVEVHDAETGELVDRFEIGEQAFARTTFRTLAHERQRQEGSMATPFRLELRESGSLRLIDPETDMTLELRAFGPTNAQAFAEFLPQPITLNGAGQSVAADVAFGDEEQ